MARKKGGKSKGFISKGERPNVKSDTKRLMRNEVTLLETTLNKQKAFRKGKNVVLTIPNPNTKETNKRFIKVNAKDVWGSPNKAFTMKS